MANLTIFLAAFSALLLLTDASISRPAVTVDEESCREQFGQQQHLRRCQQFIRQEMREERGYDLNPFRRGLLQRCCDQLEEIESRCRCDGLRLAVQRQEEVGQLEREEIREALQTARDIPDMCNLSPGRCHFRIPRSMPSSG